MEMLFGQSRYLSFRNYAYFTFLICVNVWTPYFHVCSINLMYCLLQQGNSTPYASGKVRPAVNRPSNSPGTVLVKDCLI